MGGSAPSIPTMNPGIIDTQAQQANQLAGTQSQAASNVNQVTPYGSLSYTQTGTGPGGIPEYTATTNLSPDTQAQLNLQQQAGINAGTSANNLLAGYNPSNPTGQIGNMTSGLTGQMENSYLSSVLPYQKQALASEQATLANQGLTPGNHAYDLAMQNFVQGQNQANLGAAAQFQPQAFNEATSLYGMPVTMAGELSQLNNPANLSQNLINTPTAQIAPPNVLGAYGLANQDILANAKLQEEQYGSQQSGLFGLGSAAIKMLPMLAMMA